jgi:hypothetical protein
VDAQHGGSAVTQDGKLIVDAKQVDVHPHDDVAVVVTSSFLNGAPKLSLSAMSVSIFRVSKSARTIGDESICTGMGGSHGRPAS